MPASDPAKLKATQARYREKNREAILARRRASYQANAEEARQRSRDYRKANAESVLAYNRAYFVGFRKRLRDEMIAAYGSACSCCGERNPFFLQLDHIHNDGHKDRREHKTSTKLCAVLKRQGWPKDRYQLLCANCNFGKLLNGGVCPHKREAGS